MSPAPREYTPEWHDEVNLSIHNRLGEIRDQVKKFDGRQFTMLLAALGQAGTFIIGLIIAIIKFG
jgi:hypothetical protein